MTARNPQTCFEQQMSCGHGQRSVRRRHAADGQGDLLVELNATDRRTIVLVLDDLHDACRYAHHLVAMRDGKIVAQGEPRRIVTPGLVRDVFGVDCVIVDDPDTGAPLVVPRAMDRLAQPAAPSGDAERIDDRAPAGST